MRRFVHLSATILLSVTVRCSSLLLLPRCHVSWERFAGRPRWLEGQRQHSNRRGRRSAFGCSSEQIAHRNLSRTKHESKISRRFRLSAVILLLMQFCNRAAIASTDSSSIRPTSLSAINLGAAAAMMVALAVLPLRLLGIPLIPRALVLSAGRCALQVFFLGCVMLQKVMGVKEAALVFVWIFVVGLIAAREAFSRVEYSYPRLQRDLYVCVLSGGFTVLGLMLALRVLGQVQPWFEPRTWIPVAGMLFGNSLSATALGASTITRKIATLSDQVELRLSRGGTWRESVLPIIQETFSIALTPTLNGLAVTGIVHIPGMMTGQILAGQPVSQAAVYQIMISLLIATTACMTVQLLVQAATHALVDKKSHSLRHGILCLRKKNDKADSTRLQEAATLDQEYRSEQKFIAPLRGIERCAKRAADVVLEARNMETYRSAAVVSFSLTAGSRVGIVGRSGAGKSQILRAVAGLESHKAGTLEFRGCKKEEWFPPEYRTKVCLISQNRPTLQGSPRTFYEEVLNFQSQTVAQRERCVESSPLHFLKKWDLDQSAFYQEWQSLSGGETQRISLAIALSLQPEVLLLDESMSALDNATCQLLESSLIETGIPIIMVTHSTDQLKRFCTQQMDVSSG